MNLDMFRIASKNSTAQHIDRCIGKLIVANENTDDMDEFVLALSYVHSGGFADVSSCAYFFGEYIARTTWKEVTRAENREYIAVFTPMNKDNKPAIAAAQFISAHANHDIEMAYTMFSTQFARGVVYPTEYVGFWDSLVTVCLECEKDIIERETVNITVNDVDWSDVPGWS